MFRDQVLNFSLSMNVLLVLALITHSAVIVGLLIYPNRTEEIIRRFRRAWTGRK